MKFKRAISYVHTYLCHNGRHIHFDVKLFLGAIPDDHTHLPQDFHSCKAQTPQTRCDKWPRNYEGRWRSLRRVRC